MSAVLGWIKTNVASVIFIVVMIGAIAALPYLAGRMNDGVQKDMNARMGQLAELRKLEKTSVEITPLNGAPIKESVLVNENLLARFLVVSEAEREDAARVMEAARKHNRKGRGVLHENLFPAPPPAEREVVPEQFHRALDQAYAQLLEGVNAGSPPTLKEMTAKIESARQRFLTHTLQKDVQGELNEEERTQLREVLTKQRMSLYAEQAERVGLYVSVDALRVPPWEQANQPTLAELYDWQWQYWIIDDVMRALARANEGAGGARYSVQNAPVKRVLDVVVYQSTTAEAPSGAPNPSAEVRPDYSVSFTGRFSNPLFDVRNVELRLVVDTAKLPVLLDALARRNFITVLDVDMHPDDHYEAAKQGFFYGSEPVSLVTLELETLWLRSWTSQFMPDETKLALGVPLPKPPGE